MEPDIYAAIIGLAGVIVGVGLSEVRAFFERRAQQTAMLFELVQRLSGNPVEIVSGASIAMKYQKRNQSFHDTLIPVLLASSLRLCEKELTCGSLTKDEKYALYVIWCVIGSTWTTRSDKSRPDIKSHYSEFEHVEQLYLSSSVGQHCGEYAMTKDFHWLLHEGTIVE